MDGELRLRPVEEAELPDMLRLLWDPAAPGEYQWFGFRRGTATACSGTTCRRFVVAHRGYTRGG
jgi:hypothetical protein